MGKRVKTTAGEERNAVEAGRNKATCRTAAIVCGLSSFLTPFMGAGMNVALPALGREFSMSAVSLGWVTTAYQLAAAMFLVPFGRYADIKGRKRIFVLGLGVFTVCSLLAAFAPGGGWLIAFRALQGFGGAMIFGTGVAILTSVYPVGERGRALGINTAMTYLGLSLGPVVGGFLVRAFGWRSIFWAAVPFSLCAMTMAMLKLDADLTEARDEKFDLTGSALFGAGLVFLMYGFSKLPTVPGIVLTASGLALLVWFASFESRTASPVLDVGLFRTNRLFAFSNLAALINYSATFAVGFLLSLYLQYIKGLPVHQAGLVLIAQAIVMALVSPFTGRLSEQIEPRILASAGMAVSAIGLGLLSLLGPGTPLAYTTAVLALLGLGFGLFSSPNTNAVMCSVDRKMFGTASATLGTMRLSGQMFSAGITMMIFALFLGQARITPVVFPAFMRSLRTAFVFYAVICGLGVFASLARGCKNKT